MQNNINKNKSESSFNTDSSHSLSNSNKISKKQMSSGDKNSSDEASSAHRRSPETSERHKENKVRVEFPSIISPAERRLVSEHDKIIDIPWVLDEQE